MKRLIKDEKGMMTVEVIIGLTIYIVFFVLMMNLLNVIYIKQKFQAAMTPVAIQMSREYEIEATVAEDGAGYEKNMLTELMRRRKQGMISTTPSCMSKDSIGEQMKLYAKQELFVLTADFKSKGHASTDDYRDMWIVGGFNGISFDQTKINENDSGEIELVIEYKIRIVDLPLFGDAGINIPVKQTASTKLWE